MENIQNIAIIYITIILAVFFPLATSDFEYMVRTPEPIAVPSGFETRLLCEMNIEPDTFQWKFYPTKYPYDPKILPKLNNGTFHIIDEDKFQIVKKKSMLHLQVNATTAGDYQCLAYYGASVVSSVPWKVTLATLRDFPSLPNFNETVTIGNNVLWHCPMPDSNPIAVIDYFKNKQPVMMTTTTTTPSSTSGGGSLILKNVTSDDSGLYTCTASNLVRRVNSSSFFALNVVKYAQETPPRFIMEPKKIYRAVKGDTVLLECSAVGNPVPVASWSKTTGGAHLPNDRFHFTRGGLKIFNVTKSDDGVYVCQFQNKNGKISRHLTLVYNEEPSVKCPFNSTEIKQGENLDIECVVKGIPEPHVYWFLNGFTVINDSSIEGVNNKIYIRPTEKRHAGNLQIFALNNIKITYASISIKVIPIVTTDNTIIPTVNNNNNKHKHRHDKPMRRSSTRKPSKQQKMVPPSKPLISRLNDESVVVRWRVPQNNGLPIMFFKVQYRELGPAGHETHKGSRWKTMNADISPNIKVYDVNNLKPDHVYKFRIAAVYSNNDNKLSPNSDKFHLQRLDFDDRNPLPTPLITRTETVNATSVKIYWKFTKMENISVDGFYVSYMSATTAGDYMKDTVDGEDVRDYVITHLQPDTIYDIKLQSYNTEHASEFSPIMKARTEAIRHLTTTSLGLTTSTPAPGDSHDTYNIYVVVAGGVIGCALLTCTIALLFVCRKWQRKKTDNRDNKSNVETHDNVASSKPIQRTNGCASNRITITANPLSDVDNKKSNAAMMMEMSRLTTSQSQNNNCCSSDSSIANVTTATSVR